MAIRRVVALKAVVTANCRQIHGKEGAFDEAVRRMRDEYNTIVGNWTEKGKGDVPTFNLILEVEYPA